MKKKIAIHHFQVHPTPPHPSSTTTTITTSQVFITIVMQKQGALGSMWKSWMCEKFFVASSELTVVPKKPLPATWLSCMTPVFRDIRELLQRKRFRLRKRNYGNEFAFFQNLSRLFQLAQNAESGLEFAETAPMRKKNLSWYVYILHKTSTKKHLTSWPCMGGKEMY